MSDLIRDGIEKAIFLDIDGVLNDDHFGIKIEEERVALLAKIVKETGASIVLSSSWRYMYTHYIDGEPRRRYEEIDLLLDIFKKYDLKIESMTPRYFDGPDGRPFEIRSWLALRPDIKRFVILDDDTFWMWNWLSDSFVCTCHITDEKKRVDGLTEEDVQRAIEILNKPINNGIR